MVKIGFKKGHKETEETRLKRIKSLTGRKLSKEHRKKLKEIRPKGKDHPNWKGGRRVEQGYVYLYQPGSKHSRGVAEHRLVMENKIGRKLKSSEIVHHINKNRSDNRVENLLLVTNKTHKTVEGKLKVCCPFCKGEFGI